MATKVDTGKIIATLRFPILPNDTVESLLHRTYEHQLVLFYNVMDCLAHEMPLPESTENWTRTPFTRDEFNRLCEITPELTATEIQKRIRATMFGSWRPRINLHGFIFELKGAAGD
jgi:methionyl-tRNA formyltransferase